MSATETAMHPTQTAYAAARALYDEACAESTRRTADLPESTPEEVDAWNEASEKAYVELGLHGLFGALDKAEEALLAWSFEVARAEIVRTKRGTSKAKNLALVDELSRQVQISSIARTRALDLALRLSV